jgi:signal transduction histidine kinase
VIQRLFAIGLGIEAVTTRVHDSVVAERLDQAVTDLDNTIRQLRSSIFQLGLRSPTHALPILVLDVCADEHAALGFDPVVRFEGPVDTIDETLGGHLLAVLREALSNVARHAHATRTEVRITVDDHLGLRVEDNGIGMGGGARDTGGNGLANMAARASKLSGTCGLNAATPCGTVLDWCVPLT